MNDQVFLTGYFTNPGLRLQNCTFDAATVLEGPPANTLPNTLFECAVIGGAPVVANSAAKTEFLVSGSTSTDVSVGTVGGTTSHALFTAAYNGSGSLSWLSYASEGAIVPRAIAALRPSLGNRALQGPWGGGVADPSVPGYNQARAQGTRGHTAASASRPSESCRSEPRASGPPTQAPSRPPPPPPPPPPPTPSTHPPTHPPTLTSTSSLVRP